MNRRDYRAAFDAMDFSADFEKRALQRWRPRSSHLKRSRT